METASSQLSRLPANKKEIIHFSKKLEEEINAGTVNPLDLLRFKKAFETVFENVKDTLREAAVSEGAKYEKEFNHAGARFTLGEFGTKYAYDQCGDPVWNTLKQAIKEREAWLRGLKEAEKWIDEDSGEEFTIAPPLKTSVTSLSCKIE